MTIELKVAEAMKNDVGRGIVRLDPKTRDELGVSAGDMIEIKGKKTTGAIIWRAYPEDEGLGIIRMDGFLRQNADVSLGDKVQVKKAEIKDAQKVTLAPTQTIRFSVGFGDFLKRRLLGRPVVIGDRVVVGVLGTTLPFTVGQTAPKEMVRIADSTEILVKEGPVKVPEGREGIPSIAYEDIGGLRDEVQKIREIIELPMKHPELFEKLGIEPPKGVLLHGPPGTGKTLIARAVASETQAFFNPLNGPEIMSKFYGESEENLRKVFKDAEDNAPSIVFIDEIDAIAPKREEVQGEVERRVVAQLLSLMDGLQARGRVIVIGATNRPDAIDPALRRPGRFDREIVIGVPDRNGREEVLQIHTRGMPLYHWDALSTTQILLEEIESYNQYKEREIRELSSKIKNIQLEKEGKEKELGELLAELEKLETIEKNSLQDALENVLSEIRLRKSQRKRVEERIIAIETEIDNYSSLISKIKKDIKTNDEIKQKTKEDHSILTKIGQQLTETERNVKVRGQEDVRNFFSENIKKEKEKEIKEISEGLLKIGVISEDLRRKVITKSIGALLSDFADRTHGFVGADLESLCKEAAMSALRDILDEVDLEEEAIPPEVLENIEVTEKDFEEALKVAEPSALREVFVEVPDVGWDDVGGLKDIKRELQESVEWPIKHPTAFSKMGIKPPRGILVFGPPGCGKTLIGKAVANESDANFISVKGPEILSKWVGESEKAIREIFKKARQASPCIIFFDEIDSVASMRGMETGARVGERVLNQLLTEMDGLEELHNVTVIAATNRPELLDPALVRPGRFDKVLLVQAPDGDARLETFKVHTKDMPLAKDTDFDYLVKNTSGYSGADIEGLCREAAMSAIREVLSKEGDMDKKKVTQKHFKEALKKIRPSITDEVQEAYDNFLTRYETRELEKLSYVG